MREQQVVGQKPYHVNRAPTIKYLLEKIPTVGWECSKRWFGGLVHLYVRYSQALMCVLQLVIIHGTPPALNIHGTVIPYTGPR